MTIKAADVKFTERIMREHFISHPEAAVFRSATDTGSAGIASGDGIITPGRELLASRRPEGMIKLPEEQFKKNVIRLKEARVAYEVEPWVDNNGHYWQPKIWGTRKEDKGKPQFVSRWEFHPDSFDPDQPYEPEGILWIPKENPTKLLEDPFDLDNLRIIEKKKVIKLLEDLEGSLELTPENKTIVAMIGMGGTISMKMTDAGKQPGLSADEILKLGGYQVENRFKVCTMDFPTTIDSSQNEIDYNAEIVIAMSYVWKNASALLRRRMAGFLVAHGTDSMAPSSAYTEFMLGPNVPFSTVFVGAQKTSEDEPNDVARNLTTAFHALKKFKEVNIKTVAVVGGGDGGVYQAAGGVEKVSDSKSHAFDSSTHSPLYSPDLGLHEDEVKIRFISKYPEIRDENRQGGPSKEFKPIILRGYAPTIAITPEMGDNPKPVVAQIKNSPASVLLITTFGAFTMNEKMRKAIKLTAEATGKIVFAANPFPQSDVEHEYFASAQVRQGGFYELHVPPGAARAKMAVGLALYGDTDVEKLANFIANTDYLGEYTPNIKKKLEEKSTTKERERIKKQLVDDGRDEVSAEAEAKEYLFELPLGVSSEALEPLYEGKIEKPNIYRKPETPPQPELLQESEWAWNRVQEQEEVEQAAA